MNICRPQAAISADVDTWLDRVDKISSTITNFIQEDPTEVEAKRHARMEAHRKDVEAYHRERIQRRYNPASYSRFTDEAIDAMLSAVDEGTKGCRSSRRSDVPVIELSDFEALALEQAKEQKTLGNAEVGKKNYAAARAFYDRGIGLQPLDTELLLSLQNNLAMVCLKLGDYDAALQAASKVITQDRGNVKAILRRGAALLALGRPREAKADSQRAAQLDAGNLEAMALLEAATWESKELESAEQLPDQVVKDLRDGLAILGRSAYLDALPSVMNPSESNAAAVEVASTLDVAFDEALVSVLRHARDYGDGAAAILRYEGVPALVTAMLLDSQGNHGGATPAACLRSAPNGIVTSEQRDRNSRRLQLLASCVMLHECIFGSRAGVRYVETTRAIMPKHWRPLNSSSEGPRPVVDGSDAHPFLTIAQVTVPRLVSLAAEITPPLPAAVGDEELPLLLRVCQIAAWRALEPVMRYATAAMRVTMVVVNLNTDAVAPGRPANTSATAPTGPTDPSVVIGAAFCIAQHILLPALRSVVQERKNEAVVGHEMLPWMNPESPLNLCFLKMINAALCSPSLTVEATTANAALLFSLEDNDVVVGGTHAQTDMTMLSFQQWLSHILPWPRVVTLLRRYSGGTKVPSLSVGDRPIDKGDTTHNGEMNRLAGKVTLLTNWIGALLPLTADHAWLSTALRLTDDSDTTLTRSREISDDAADVVQWIVGAAEEVFTLVAKRNRVVGGNSGDRSSTPASANAAEGAVLDQRCASLLDAVSSILFNVVVTAAKLPLAASTGFDVRKSAANCLAKSGTTLLQALVKATSPQPLSPLWRLLTTSSSTSSFRGEEAVVTQAFASAKRPLALLAKVHASLRAVAAEVDPPVTATHSSAAASSTVRTPVTSENLSSALTALTAMIDVAVQWLSACATLCTAGAYQGAIMGRETRDDDDAVHSSSAKTAAADPKSLRLLTPAFMTANVGTAFEVLDAAMTLLAGSCRAAAPLSLGRLCDTGNEARLDDVVETAMIVLALHAKAVDVRPTTIPIESRGPERSDVAAAASSVVSRIIGLREAASTSSTVAEWIRVTGNIAIVLDYVFSNKKVLARWYDGDGAAAVRFSAQLHSLPAGEPSAAGQQVVQPESSLCAAPTPVTLPKSDAAAATKHGSTVAGEDSIVVSGGGRRGGRWLASVARMSASSQSLRPSGEYQLERLIQEAVTGIILPGGGGGACDGRPLAPQWDSMVTGRASWDVAQVVLGTMMTIRDRLFNLQRERGEQPRASTTKAALSSCAPAGGSAYPSPAQGLLDTHIQQTTSTQKNLAIAVAKLCGHPAYLAHFRALRGFEVLQAVVGTGGGS